MIVQQLLGFRRKGRFGLIKSYYWTDPYLILLLLEIVLSVWQYKSSIPKYLIFSLIFRGEPAYCNINLRVSGKAMTTQPVRQNRVLFDILYFSSCLNKQIDYLCAMDNNSCIRQQADIKQINRCKDRVSELNGSFDYLSNGLELAGNNVRLKILFLLYEEKRLCVCDISDILGMTISAVSQHLRKLKDRKLIETEREAQTIFYSLTKEYEKMLKPFFKILDENKILETL